MGKVPVFLSGKNIFCRGVYVSMKTKVLEPGLIKNAKKPLLG
jgi:hypothetical protein